VESLAEGFQATASADGATALGRTSSVQAGATDGVAIGTGATVSAANSVALGANSTTTANLALAAFNPGTGTIAGATPVGEVSVGSAGAQRRVTNVAAGAAATDAVNVSQLQAVSSQVNQVTQDALLWDPTANGGAGAFSASHAGAGPNNITNVADGAINATSTDAVNGSQLFAINQNVTNVSNEVNDIVNNGVGIKYFHANSTLADSQAQGTDSVAIGPAAVSAGASSLAAGNGAQSQADNSLALGAQSTASVAGGVAVGSGSVSNRAIAPGIGSITIGTSAVPFNTANGTLLGAVSFGSSAGNTFRQLTNVADGTSQHDAVTVEQLANSLSSFATTTQKYFHANSAAADSLAVGAESVAVGPQTVVNGGSGVGIGNGATVQQLAPGGVAIGEQANSGQVDAIAVGSGANANAAESIAQGANSSVTNVGGIAIGSGSSSSAVDAVALGAGANASFANSVAIGAGSQTTVGAMTNYIAYGLSAPQSSVGEVNVGNRQITGLAAGKAGTDAVNVSQLDAVASQLTQLISNSNSTGGGGGFSTNPTGSGASTGPSSTGSNSSAGGTGSSATGAGSTAVGNNSQSSGSNSTAVGTGATSSGNGSVAIGSNSSDGGRNDVVSVGSATNSRQVVNVAAGTAPTDAVNVQQLNQTLQQANGYTDNQIAGLRNQIDTDRRDADGGTAAAMAIAALPQPSGPGMSMVSLGGSVYRGQTGQALGVSTISENNHWVYKAAVSTNSRGTYGGAVAAGYQW
jgi:autotransporter adhesin